MNKQKMDKIKTLPPFLGFGGIVNGMTNFIPFSDGQHIIDERDDTVDDNP